MSIHESGLNFQNLIRDLAEMYPFEVAEVVLVELVANSLDARATRIGIDYDPQGKVLVVEDNGAGMVASQFEEYHDFAAGLKTRGTGIGFAGVGAKISFNIAECVVTETRSESFCGGSKWYLQSKKKLTWEDILPSHLRGNGTRVEVKFRSDAILPYSDTEGLIQLLRRHYLPLLDSSFLDLYERMGHYRSEMRFIINGQSVAPSDIAAELALVKVRRFFPTKAGKRIGYGIFGLAASEYPIAADVCGVLLSTHGKVIKPDLFNQFPGSLGPRLFGLVEVPGLINFLTTTKTDFMRARGTYREFESLYNPIRQEFRVWLTELGVQAMEFTDVDEATRLERELKKLIEDIPELGEFFGFRTRKTILQQDDSGTVNAVAHEGAEVTFPDGEGDGKGILGPVDIGDEPGSALVEVPEGGTQKADRISRTARRGPNISFLSDPDRIDLAWVDGNNVIINSGHPSYAKARSNPLARRICCLFAIGSAVQKFLATDSTPDLAFVDRLMAAWGKK